MKDIKATVIVDLRVDVEKLMAGLHKDARWGIGRAKREGLVVEESNSEDDWEKFYEIYENTMRGVGTNVETLKHLKENAKVFFTCKKEGKLIAGATLDIVKGNPYLSRNASLKEFQSLQPNNLLYWNCIVWSKANGFDKLDLGGWQMNARGHAIGVNKYKERWGDVEFSLEDYPMHVAIGRKIIRGSAFFKWLNDKIRGRT